MRNSCAKARDNRTIGSKLNGASDWTNFVHDELSGMLLAEYTLISGTFTVKCLYTNGIGLISANREGTKRYFHFDGLGSTYALSDENENLKDSYSYSTFGVTLSATSTNGPSTNPNRFVGRWGYYDDSAMGSGSGLVLLGIRYLEASRGRFLSWDPIRSTNNYDYVRNRTTRLTDSTGLQPIAIQVEAGGAAGIGGEVSRCPRSSEGSPITRSLPPPNFDDCRRRCDELFLEAVQACNKYLGYPPSDGFPSGGTPGGPWQGAKEWFLVWMLCRDLAGIGHAACLARCAMDTSLPAFEPLPGGCLHPSGSEWPKW